MDLKQEIAKQVESLPPALQEQVLRYISSLHTSPRMGENGAALRRFSSSLDSASALQMIQAIEEECERVEAGEW
jgi:hypothetical protein